MGRSIAENGMGVGSLQYWSDRGGMERKQRCGPFDESLIRISSFVVALQHGCRRSSSMLYRSRWAGRELEM
jgi:hypothetical protein